MIFRSQIAVAFMWCLVVLGGSPLTCFADQEFERLSDLYHEGRIEEIRIFMPGLLKKRPTAPDLLYLAALVDTSAIASKTMLTQALKYSRDSVLSGNLHLELAEASWLETQRETAVNHLDSALEIQPGLVNNPAAIYLWLAIREAQMVPAPAALQSVRSRFTTMKDVSPRSRTPDGAYTIQMGAFSQTNNAVQLAAKLSDAGFSARIDTDKGLNLVRVGHFSSETEAKRRAAGIQRKTGLEGQILLLENAK